MPSPIPYFCIGEQMHIAYATMLELRKDRLSNCDKAMITADCKNIDQVIENLLGNVAKYSPAGTDIVISCEPCGTQVEIGYQRY